MDAGASRTMPRDAAGKIGTAADIPRITPKKATGPDSR